MVLNPFGKSGKGDVALFIVLGRVYCMYSQLGTCESPAPPTAWFDGTAFEIHDGLVCV